LKFLFICGCPRSGTTALWKTITAHHKTAIGVERYINLAYPTFKLNQTHFLKERFFKNNPGESRTDNFNEHQYYKELYNRYTQCNLFGDKIPFLYENYDPFYKSFPNATILYIVRNIYDVAQSYKVRFLDDKDPWNRNIDIAVSDWNKANKNTLFYLEKKRKIHVIEYEHLFFESKNTLALRKFLELNDSENMRRTFKNMKILAQRYDENRQNSLSSTEKLFIQKNTDFSTYKKLIKQST